MTKKVAIVHFKSKLFACSGQWGMGDGRWEMGDGEKIGEKRKILLNGTFVLSNTLADNLTFSINMPLSLSYFPNDGEDSVPDSEKEKKDFQRDCLNHRSPRFAGFCGMAEREGFEPSIAL
ncbi:MAG: hypothetical protein WCG19_10830 [Chlorobiaceae bacterium]